MYGLTFDQWVELQWLDDPSPTATAQMRLAWEAAQIQRDREFAALLPDTLYMDPPDGGDVSVLGQVARMSYDAAAWRAISS